jgi:hypothetical protein
MSEQGRGRCGLVWRLVELRGILVDGLGYAAGVIKRVRFGLVVSFVGVMSVEHG